ncbi:hypothetical protein EPK99_03265 [Neorhizobium lilium]|uniref:Uncharacterized protein n=1 Tax=Neorhizobium lilium TaxID=2503024 RepID=A0A444LLY6_9HYPH|nr:hypothetical protein [Neorhizobium lilium]RWX81344.1 hypothetical protein EPK99_03265 [Neorhizobium lilium]
MATDSAEIIDFQAYREARRGGEPSAPPQQAIASFNGLQPMFMWVPVWTFFPVMAGPWVHAQ